MQFAYISPMKVTFFETSMFSATLPGYLDDDEYRHLQRYMLDDPECGAVMPRTGGFRKLRWTDVRRGRGKRGGLRVIYYWLSDDAKIWMFAIYDKDEMEGLTSDQEKALAKAITFEVAQRKAKKVKS